MSVSAPIGSRSVVGMFCAFECTLSFCSEWSCVTMSCVVLYGSALYHVVLCCVVRLSDLPRASGLSQRFQSYVHFNPRPCWSTYQCPYPGAPIQAAQSRVKVEGDVLARLLFQNLLEHVVSQGTWAVRFQPCFERLVVGDVQRLADDCCVWVSEAERSSNQLKNSRCVSSVHQRDWLKLKNTTISERNYPISFFRVSFCLPVRSQGVGVLRSCLPASLCRAPIHGPSSEPTDTKGHTHCASRALVPTLAV